eukprot:1127607-Prorocentrum_minimum.AAC.2
MSSAAPVTTTHRCRRSQLLPYETEAHGQQGSRPHFPFSYKTQFECFPAYTWTACKFTLKWLLGVRSVVLKGLKLQSVLRTASKP